MISRSEAASIACATGIGLFACIGLQPTLVGAQPADLALCDRVAADPTDPDKPANVKGTREIVPSDIPTAIQYCKSAAAKSRRALYQLGRAYAAGQQWTEAAGTYRKAADKGSSAAMVELGVMYGTGTGVPKDEAQARRLFERAAETGNPRGVTNLAALSGGAPPSDPRSRTMLMKAAESGSAEAQYQLGLMLADGVGGAKDDMTARAWFEKAAAQDHPGALLQMGDFAASGRGGPQDAGAAKAYYEKAAALGNEDAKAALKRAACRWVIKDKSGRVVTNLCF